MDGRELIEAWSPGPIDAAEWPGVREVTVTPGWGEGFAVGDGAGTARCVLRLQGGLVRAVVDVVLDRCLAAVECLDPTEVVVDLTGIEVIDVSGVGMLRFLRDCVQRRGMCCRLSGLSAGCLLGDPAVPGGSRAWCRPPEGG